MSEDICQAIRDSIAGAIPEADIQVQGGGGHYTIAVTAAVFEGKNRVESQRLVLGAIAHLMKGEGAPVHAVDSLTTRTS